MKTLTSLAAMAVLGLMAAGANAATVTFDTGNLNPSDNIHFDTDLSTATFRTGYVSGTSPLVLVKFSEPSENLKTIPGNGLATIEGADGTFTSLDIAMADSNATFTGFDFGVAMDINGETTTPHLLVQAYLNGDLLGEKTFEAQNGNKHYRVVRTDGGMDEIRITAIGGGTTSDLITMFKQPRITGVESFTPSVPVVPVPAAVWSGLGLMGVLGVKRFGSRR